MKINPDHFDDFVPELLATTDCRAAYLIGSKERNETLSITIWDSQGAAKEYEKSGKYGELMTRAAPFLSSLYQWKLTLDPRQQKNTLSSDDVSIKGYHVVSGESILPDQA